MPSKKYLRRKRDYWKRRALNAENVLKQAYAKIRRLEDRALDNSWELEAHRETARRRRDQEIGEMGGGG